MRSAPGLDPRSRPPPPRHRHAPRAGRAGRVPLAEVTPGPVRFSVVARACTCRPPGGSLTGTGRAARLLKRLARVTQQSARLPPGVHAGVSRVRVSSSSICSVELFGASVRRRSVPRALAARSRSAAAPTRFGHRRNGAVPGPSAPLRHPCSSVAQQSPRPGPAGPRFSRALLDPRNAQSQAVGRAQGGVIEFDAGRYAPTGAPRQRP